MNKQEVLNAIYDLIAQNPVDMVTRDKLTALVDHVDTGQNAITFRDVRGKEFELKLIETYAPSEAVAKEA